MKVTVTRSSNGNLRLLGLPFAGTLPLEHRGPYTWEASSYDEEFLRSKLPEADWSAVRPVDSTSPFPEEQYGKVILRPYQQEVYRFGPHLLIADEPRLGKSYEALAFALGQGANRILVICPVGAAFQWRDYAQAMSLEPTSIIAGQPRQKDRYLRVAAQAARVVVAGYDQLARMDRWGDPRWFDAVILDEVHAVKNPDAQRTKRVHYYLSHIPHRVLVTGTPVRNYTRDLWSLLHLINPLGFPDATAFGERYSERVEIDTPIGKRVEYRGTKNWDELMVRMRPFLLMRTREEVGMVVPFARSIRSVPLSPEWTSRYDEAQSEWLHEVRRTRGRGGRVLAGITQLRQLAALGKVPAVAEWLAERSKTMVLTSFETAAFLLRDSLPPSARPVRVLTGSVRPKDREGLLREVEEQEGNLIATVRTGGESLNLQGLASTVAFLDVGWSPAELKQGEDRVKLPGQTQTSYGVYFVATDTVEEKVVRRLLDKVEGSPMLPTDFNVLSEVLE